MSSPFDIREYEQAVTYAFQFASIPSSSSSSDQLALKASAMEYCQNIKSHPDGWQAHIQLFQTAVANPQAQFYALQSLQEVVFQLSISSRVHIRQELFQWLCQMMQQPHVTLSRYLQTKLAVLWTLLIQADYPENWSACFDELHHSIDNPGLVGRKGMPFYCCVFQQLYQEIVEMPEYFGANEVGKTMKIKDAMRESSCLVVMFQLMYRECAQILKMSKEEEAGENTTTNMALACQILATIKDYISWVDIQLIVNDSWLPLLFQIMQSKNQCTTELRCLAINCLNEILLKRMDCEKKLQLIEHLNLFPSFLPQILQQECPAAFLSSFMSFDPIIAAVSDSETDDLDYLVVLEELAEVVNSLGLELVACAGAGTGGASLAILDQCLPLMWSCFCFPHREVSEEVFEIVSCLVKDPRCQSRISLSSLLMGVYRQFQQHGSYSLTEAADVEDEETFEHYRRELCKLYQQITRSNPEIVFQFLQSLMNHVVSNLAQPRQGCSEAQVVSEVEALLALVYYFPEGCSNKKQMVEECQAFQHMIQHIHVSIASSSSSLASSGHSDNIIKLSSSASSCPWIFSRSPALCLMYFEFTTRFIDSVFDIASGQSSANDVLLFILQQYIGSFGIHHPEQRVQSRAQYLLLRLCKSAFQSMKYPQQFPRLWLLQQLFTTFGAIEDPQSLWWSSLIHHRQKAASAQQRGDEGVNGFHFQFYLFELIGRLLGEGKQLRKHVHHHQPQQQLSPVSSSKEEEQACLHSFFSTFLLHMRAGQPTIDPSSVAEMIYCFGALANIVKGLPKRPKAKVANKMAQSADLTPDQRNQIETEDQELTMMLHQLLLALVPVCQLWKDHVGIRLKCLFLLHRMVDLLPDSDMIQLLPQWIHLLVLHCSIEDGMEMIQFVNQCVLKYPISSGSWLESAQLHAIIRHFQNLLLDDQEMICSFHIPPILSSSTSSSTSSSLNSPPSTTNTGITTAIPPVVVHTAAMLDYLKVYKYVFTFFNQLAISAEWSLKLGDESTSSLEQILAMILFGCQLHDLSLNRMGLSIMTNLFHHWTRLGNSSAIEWIHPVLSSLTLPVQKQMSQSIVDQFTRVMMSLVKTYFRSSGVVMDLPKHQLVKEMVQYQVKMVVLFHEDFIQALESIYFPLLHPAPATSQVKQYISLLQAAAKVMTTDASSSSAKQSTNPYLSTLEQQFQMETGYYSHYVDEEEQKDEPVTYEMELKKEKQVPSRERIISEQLLTLKQKEQALQCMKKPPRPIRRRRQPDIPDQTLEADDAQHIVDDENPPLEDASSSFLVSFDPKEIYHYNYANETVARKLEKILHDRRGVQQKCQTSMSQIHYHRKSLRQERYVTQERVLALEHGMAEFKARQDQHYHHEEHEPLPSLSSLDDHETQTSVLRAEIQDHESDLTHVQERLARGRKKIQELSKMQHHLRDHQDQRGRYETQVDKCQQFYEHQMASIDGQYREIQNEQVDVELSLARVQDVLERQLEESNQMQGWIDRLSHQFHACPSTTVASASLSTLYLHELKNHHHH